MTEEPRGTDPAVAPGQQATFSHRQILAILSGLMLGMFLAALDQTIVATAMRTIADDLDGYALQAWVTTAYLITATLVTPLYGKLSDIYGRKQFFMAAIVLFVIGSVLCTFAQSMYMLAVFRAIQGLGAGGLFSLALAIVGDIVSPRERARYQGYFLAVFGTSSVLGPVIGGLLSGQPSILGIAGWRWVFLVNVPIGLVALAVVWRVLHLPPVHRPMRIDWWGALVLAVGLVPILVVAEQGRAWGWTSPESLTCYAIGVVGVLGFVVVEYFMKDAALFPLHFFRGQTFALGVLISFLVGAVMFGAITVIPQYLQVVQGSSPTLAGFQMLPAVLGIAIGSVVSGQLIARTGRYRIFTIVGAVLIAVAALLLHSVTAHTSLYVFMTFIFVLGLGLGNLLQPLTLAIQNALPPKDMGVSTASATFFRQIGGTRGVALFLSILFAQLTPSITTQLQDAARSPEFQQAVAAGASSPNPVEAEIARGLMSGDPSAASAAMNDTSFIEQLNPTLAAPFKDGFAIAFEAVYPPIVVLAVVSLVLILIWREVPLRQKSGVDADESVDS
ncbi:DHA2 family efflux MFS transporter permease subunit [Rhodococcus hoagii]|uniref:MDR family MFS transporter n=1 Tax=Rhodococcus hoagii TaxID=43767 RepID=UPI0007CD6832|nr:MDR family MFS transporter [Prescottella equi]MBM4535028.1 DHA2 family efflux MFS transporter permease subunit [Prescottella equi]NKR80863.1 DHA2 family efflux MFS transporter permease subunit [Prescottella equi]ORL00801.1 MFS transporter [Prescottella equi]ORL04091.1 MFS transporter [Prescottella equi]ORL77322.1 MFS transporter [Prescottella equi]